MKSYRLGVFLDRINFKYRLTRVLSILHIGRRLNLIDERFIYKINVGKVVRTSQIVGQKDENNTSYTLHRSSSNINAKFKNT